MGCTTSEMPKQPENTGTDKSNTKHNGNDNNNNKTPHTLVTQSTANTLIPFQETDTVNEKIIKIRERWKMNKKNCLLIMRDLKFDRILQICVSQCLVDDETVYYIDTDDIMSHLIENEINRSIFWQYWKMDKIISCDEVIRRHFEYAFTFQNWKIDEQIAYITDDDLPFLPPFHPVLNTTEIINDNIQMGDIVCTLEPRWYTSNMEDDMLIPQTQTIQSSKNEESMVKMSSFVSPATSPKTSVAVHHHPQHTEPTPNSAKPKRNNRRAMKQSLINFSFWNLKKSNHNHNNNNTNSKNNNNTHKNDDTQSNHMHIHQNHHDAHETEIIEIKLMHFRDYMTLQALCSAVTIVERELLTLRSHRKMQGKNMHIGNLLNANDESRESSDEHLHRNHSHHNHHNNHNTRAPQKRRKKFTDIVEDVASDPTVIFHNGRPDSHNFYFTLHLDRTTALIKVQQLVIRINQIIYDLSFLYSIVGQASESNQSAPEFVADARQYGREHLLSITASPNPAVINICAGLAKYWADVDTKHSLLRRVRSALQFSALGAVFMYPKDYAARTKWRTGDNVLVYKQTIEHWCHGRIVQCLPDDDVQVRYQIPTEMMSTHNQNESMILREEIEEDNMVPSLNMHSNSNKTDRNNNNSRATHATKHKHLHTPSNSMLKKVSFKIQREKKRSSRIQFIDLDQLSVIDYENDTTLETMTVNRYDRDFIRPLIVRNGCKSPNMQAFSPRKSELLDMVTGLANRFRLDDRLLDICSDRVLAGLGAGDVEELQLEDELLMIAGANAEHNPTTTMTAMATATGTKGVVGEQKHNSEDSRDLSAENDSSGEDGEEDDDDDDDDDNDYETPETPQTPQSPFVDNEQHRVITGKNIHPMAFVLLEIDQLSKKVNLFNRQSAQFQNEEKYRKQGYNSDLIMKKVSELLENAGKHFNTYITTTGAIEYNEQGNYAPSSFDSHSDYTEGVFNCNRISIDIHGRKKIVIKSEAFRYGRCTFGLLLHNTDVAKSLMVCRFIQKEICDLCSATTDFQYDEQYLTISMAIANVHYNEERSCIIDTGESWHDRCLDALKTIRYEGGHGVTHADILSGQASNANQIGFGIVHERNDTRQRSSESNNNNTMNLMNITTRSPTDSIVFLSGGNPNLTKNQNNNAESNNNGNKSKNNINNNDKNKTITWISGRDTAIRKYTFV